MKSSAMRIFKVTGWEQYKNDCALPIERTQIALSEEDAARDVVTNLSQDDRKVVVRVTEIK